MNAEPFALDSNILVYTVDRSAREKQRRAREIVRLAASRPCVLALQSIGEFFVAATRKTYVSRKEAARRARDWMTVFPIVAADPKAVETALEAAGAERLSYWDAVLIATLAQAGCTTLLSEDMQDGATAAGVLVRNPFAGDELPDAVARLLGA